MLDEDVLLEVRGHIGRVVAVFALVPIRGGVNPILVIFQRRLRGKRGPTRRAQMIAQIEMDLADVALDVGKLVVAVVAAGERATVPVWDQAFGPMHGLVVFQSPVLVLVDGAAVQAGKLSILFPQLRVVRPQVGVELQLLEKHLATFLEIARESVVVRGRDLFPTQHVLGLEVSLHIPIELGPELALGAEEQRFCLVFLFVMLVEQEISFAFVTAQGTCQLLRVYLIIMQSVFVVKESLIVASLFLALVDAQSLGMRPGF